MSGHYEKDGIKFPRVTSIISDCNGSKEGLLQWSANEAIRWLRENMTAYDTTNINGPHYKVCESDLQQARYAYKDTSRIALDVGSEVHRAIEDFLKGKPAVLTTVFAENSFDAFLEWKSKNNLEVIALEQTVWGDRWAGTADCICLLNGKKYVIDWKTSKAFYMTEMGAQIAAYRSCLPDVEGSGILRLDKETGMPHWKDFSKRYERDLAVFNAMVSLYYLKHKLIAKRFEK